MHILQSLIVCAILFCCAAPALAQETASIASWQNAMHSASKHMEDNNFAEAQKEFEAAKSAAEAINNNDAKYFSLVGLADSLSEQGKYAEAESLYRQAAALPDGDEAYSYVTLALEKQLKFSEATAVRKEHYETTAQRKLGMAAMPGIQKEIKQHWKVRGWPLSAWSVATFRIPPPGQTPVAYISSSSGDSLMDKASLKAITQAKFPVIEGLKRRPGIQFTFNYNLYTAETFGPLDKNPESSVYQMRAARYRKLRDRLAKEEKVLGPDHPECLGTMLSAAEVLKDASREELRETAYRHVITVCENKGWNCDALFSARVSLGQLLFAQRKYAEAEEVLRKALAMREEMYAKDAYVSAEPASLLAKTLSKLHRDGEAKQLLTTLNK